MNDVVELHEAFWWTCDACGRDSFVRSVMLDMPREDAIELARAVGAVPPDFEFDDDDEPYWKSSPEEVTCDHCGEKYRTEDSE